MKNVMLAYEPSPGWLLKRAALILFASSAVIGCSKTPAEGAPRGEVLYTNCVTCHQEDGGGSVDFDVPAIAGLPAWYIEAQLGKFGSGARGSDHRDIQGLRMRPMARTLRGETDVQAVSAYIAAMTPTDPTPIVEGGDAARGQQLFEGTCRTCHGEGGVGDQAQNAPPLNHASDWYLVTQIQNFRAGIRGTNPADLTGASMRPMALSLADEQAIKDVVAYISSLD